jgi:hypothetical protein
MFARLSFVGVALCLSAGCSGMPSRTSALALISGHEVFTTPVTTFVPVSPWHCEATNAFAEQYQNFDHFVDNRHKELRASSVAGILIVSGTDQTMSVRMGSVPELCQEDYVRMLRATFSGSGLGISHQWWTWESRVSPAAQEAGVASEGGNIAVGNRKVSEVTGVSDKKDGSALAEFKYQFQPTPAGEAMKFSVEERSGVATLRRFDDGWRAVEVTLN